MCARAYRAAYERECTVIAERVPRMASGIREPAGLWRIHNFLTEKRNETDEKYDCSYSLLLWVFSRLMVEGGISEDDLRCLINTILTAHSMAKFDSGTQWARQGPPQSQRSRQVRHS